MKSIFTLLLCIGFSGLVLGQSLIPTPFTFSSCSFGVSPNGWVNCNTSPDCAASRCTVPPGCAGQAVMCFGESFYYMLPSPLVIGQNYTVSMNVSVGQLGANSIIAGNHTFNVIGLPSAPTNCFGPFGNVCSTPGSTLLLSGTVNTIGWQNFTNTFTATSTIQCIVIGNCDGTGNGGNLFCSFSLTNSVVFPVELAAFNADPNGCEVNLNWEVAEPDNENLAQFQLTKSVEGKAEEIVAQVEAQSGRREYAFQDAMPALNTNYQLSMIGRDGSISQSKVLQVKADCRDLHNVIEGNPVTGPQATLRYQATGASGLITIQNLEGRIVHSVEIENTDAGWHRQTLDVSALQPGLYFVTTGSGEVTKLQIAR